MDDDTEHGWAWGIVLIVAVIAIGTASEAFHGPRYHSPSGLGATMQGRQLNLWEREMQNNNPPRIQELR